MKQTTNYLFVDEYESCEGLTCVVEEDEMLYDIKKLLSDHYIATFDIYGKALNISFNNGQKFGVTVQEKTVKAIK